VVAVRNVSSPYATTPERLDWFQRFNLAPTAPSVINERLRNGESIVTMDIPSYLGPTADTDCETGVALYRLVQLWGTPNVPGMTAGAMEFDRERTSWQYLFDVAYDRRDEDGEDIPETFRLAVYDYKTDVSAGFADFVETDEAIGTVEDPDGEPVPAAAMPPDHFLEGVMALALNMVDEAVPATYKELWI
jgi:hypothetical protein